ncbi:hypothetical protein [Fodinicola feengrottensis]|uniref:hypothetical protein n=1 Tax=Fodinicola feengrottensis TaxID=435914 RepID=UPI0024423DA3|nr:hypothetical protein [Fodinicola feengrottensis]
MVEYAFTVSPHQHGAREALNALRGQTYGETPLRTWLREQWRQAEALSDDAAEAGDNKAGFGHSLHARALAGSYHAVVADPEAAALDSVYETQGMAGTRDLLDSILAGNQGAGRS